MTRAASPPHPPPRLLAIEFLCPSPHPPPGLVCFVLLDHLPTPPTVPAQPSPSSLLCLQTPEPAGLTLRTEESDAGNKSQDPHPQYSPVLKKEKPRALTQKEGSREPKEVLGRRNWEEAGQKGGEDPEDKKEAWPVRSGATGRRRALQRARALAGLWLLP